MIIWSAYTMDASYNSWGSWGSRDLQPLFVKKWFILIGGKLLYYIVVVFAIHWHESTMGVHVSPSWAPSHLPSHPIPLGCPSALALSALLHALNLDWSSISQMGIYMFQCYFLKSSHPHLLPQTPKVFSLYLCLFCCLAHGGHCYHLSKFHIYVLKYCIGVESHNS